MSKMTKLNMISLFFQHEKFTEKTGNLAKYYSALMSY